MVREDEAALTIKRYQPLTELLSEGGAGCHVSGGNNLDIFTKGTDKLSALLDDIARAKEYIHFQYYLFGKDVSSLAVREALIDKAHEGVKVRILHENIANYNTPRSFYKKMREAGIEIRSVFNPWQNPLTLPVRLNRRNHRKIVVIDGKAGYTGGMNIKDRYFTNWRDTHLCITGPAVSSLQRIFLDKWKDAGGTTDKPEDYYLAPDHTPGIMGKTTLRGKTVQIAADGPDSKKRLIERSYIWALDNAKSFFWLQTPYFIPTKKVLDALKKAAKRGIDVRVMVPKEPETAFLGYAAQSYYKECLEAGIHIIERGGGFIHAKTFVSDDCLSCIGSANLDNRSFGINYEVNTYIYDSETALRCKDIFEDDVRLSVEASPDNWRSQPVIQVLMQRLFRLFAKQL